MIGHVDKPVIYIEMPKDIHSSAENGRAPEDMIGESRVRYYIRVKISDRYDR